MSPKTLQFHFDFGSPTTYLAYTQVPRIAQVVAGLRALALEELRKAVWRNALDALPKIAALV